MQMRDISWAPHILYVVLQRPVLTDEKALGPSAPNQSCLHSVIWHNMHSHIIGDKKWESHKMSVFSTESLWVLNVRKKYQNIFRNEIQDTCFE